MKISENFIPELRFPQIWRLIFKVTISDTDKNSVLITQL